MNRAYDFVPGTLAWGTIAAMFLFSWVAPVATAIFIILFDIYWLLKTVYLSFYLRATFKKMRANAKIDWLKKLQDLPKEKYNQNFGWQDIFHLIIFPTYKEPYEVVHETFTALAKSNYPKDKFIVVLATEARAGQASQETAHKIKKEFEKDFFRFVITAHPADLEGEIPGKGSNQAWAAKEVKEAVVDSLKIPYEQILISVFDVDTQIGKNYFGILSYHFLTCQYPQNSSFQPVPFFNNNIFEAPAFARVISFSSSFWHMIQQARPHRLTTFSSHSMPFKAIVEIGYWNKDSVSEDSQIFWKCYLHYNGNWRVIPINYGVSMDANVAPTFVKTIVNTYKQQRRWGWGCENIPYLLKGFENNKNIPFRKKIYWSFNYIEGFHSWATNALIIFFLGWLPIALGGPDFRFSLLSYNLPKITSTIMNLSMLGITTSAILGIILLPPKPLWFKWYHNFLYVVQWALLPVTFIAFGAVPALESQTRLILGGKYRLGFWVTPKHRK